VPEKIPQELIDRFIIKLKTDEKLSGKKIFGNDNALKIEIGSGNGHFLVDVALANKDINYIGIELKFARVCKTISKCIKRNIDNIRIYYGDAIPFIASNITESSVSEFYYNFPDPWPKRKQFKKRIVTPVFLDNIYRIMTDDAIFTFVTDHDEYLNWVVYYVEKDKRFENVFDPKIVNHLEGYPCTLFEKMWRDMGKTIYYYRFKKR